MENSMTETTTAKMVKLGEEEFHKLPFDDKRNYLDGLPPGEKVNLVLGDPDDQKLARAMQPQELYWLFKEVGAPDSMELLGLASPEQCLFHPGYGTLAELDVSGG